MFYILSQFWAGNTKTTIRDSTVADGGIERRACGPCASCTMGQRWCITWATRVRCDRQRGRKQGVVGAATRAAGIARIGHGWPRPQRPIPHPCVRPRTRRVGGSLGPRTRKEHQFLHPGPSMCTHSARASD